MVVGSLFLLFLFLWQWNNILYQVTPDNLSFTFRNHLHHKSLLAMLFNTYRFQRFLECDLCQDCIQDFEHIGNTTGVFHGTGTTFCSTWVHISVAQCLVLCVIFCGPLFVILFFFFWPFVLSVILPFISFE